jgi:hypothetical protein
MYMGLSNHPASLLAFQQRRTKQRLLVFDNSQGRLVNLGKKSFLDS